MHSRTKRRLSPAQIDALTLHTLGAAVASAEEVHDGSLASVWRLGLEDGRTVLLKISPPPDLPTLTYERELLRTEAMVYRLAGPAGVPLPELLHAGFDSPLVDGDYLIVQALDGVPWNRARLSDAEQRVLRHELGRHLAALHTVPGTGVFGYPHAGLTGATWREAFLKMSGAVLDDAVRYGIRLPLSMLDLARLVHTRSDALDEVTVPSLVHFDIWPGNVFLTRTDQGPRIQGLVGHERAFWGDPLADFVTPTLFGELSEHDPLLAGYREAGGQVPTGPGAGIRDALYRMYLYLIMLVEEAPRGYPAQEYARTRELATQGLLRACETLRRR